MLRHKKTPHFRGAFLWRKAGGRGFTSLAHRFVRSRDKPKPKDIAPQYSSDTTCETFFIDKTHFVDILLLDGVDRCRSFPELRTWSRERRASLLCGTVLTPFVGSFLFHILLTNPNFTVQYETVDFACHRASSNTYAAYMCGEWGISAKSNCVAAFHAMPQYLIIPTGRFSAIATSQ